jgi:hypothetical protein
VYRIFIDEVGNSDLASSVNDNERFLSLTGVIVRLEYHDFTFTQQINQMKCAVFGRDSVVLHRREISRREPPFEALREDHIRRRFDSRMLDLYGELDYSVVTVTIDKREHLDRYRVWRYHPYHYCLAVMLERYIMFLNQIGQRGDVMAESRERVDNERLSSAYQYFYRNGSDWMQLQSVQQALTSGEIKIKRKEANIAGLQIADLLAHPSFRFCQSKQLQIPMTAPFGSRVGEILEARKYLRNYHGVVSGVGRKWLP